MRVLLVDLPASDGIVSKDTVVGGYGSRLLPFTKVTTVIGALKRRLYDVPSVQLAYIAGVLSQYGHDVIWSRGEIPEADVAIVLSSLVDHRHEAAWADLPEMLALAKLPNVAVKMSGAPSYSSAPYPYKNIHGYLKQIFDAFGPQRCFWGTDITRMPCSYRQCVTMFTEELPWLKGRDQELVMGRAVCDWLGWKHPALAGA